MSSTECIVMGPLASIFRVSRIYGIAPVNLIALDEAHSRLASSNAYRASASQKICICSSIVVVIYMMCNIARIVYFKTYETLLERQMVKTLFWSIVYFGQILCNSIIILMTAFGGYNRMVRFVDYLYTLEKLNWKMGNNYANIKIKYSKVIFWGSLLIIYFIGAIFVSIPLLDYPKQMSLVLAYVFDFNSRVFTVLLQLQFVFFVCLVNVTADVLQQKLQTLILKPEIHTTLGNKNENSVHITIQNLHYIYKSLCELVKKIDEEEGTINFLIFIFKIVDIMDAIYILVEEPGLRILQVIWIIYIGATLTLSIELCHQTVNKFQIIRVSVSHLICLSTKGDAREELYAFSNQLMQNAPKFSPLGMFTFTRQLILGTVGVLVSYLVIIL